MLWQHYVFRRGTELSDMWDRFFRDRPINLLYIAGRGFDPRAQTAIKQFVSNILSSAANIVAADLLLVGFDRYELDQDLEEATEANAISLRATFSELGATEELNMDAHARAMHCARALASF